MNSKIEKGSKPFVIKVFATIMCVCYLLTPLHKEIGDVLHKIVHELDIPESVLSHSNTIGAKGGKIHYEHALVVPENSHDHNFLEVLGDIMEAAQNEKKSEDSNVLVVKIDKHTRYQEKYKKPSYFLPSKPNVNSFFVTGQTCLGHLKAPLRPPQLF